VFAHITLTHERRSATPGSGLFNDYLHFIVNEEDIVERFLISFARPYLSHPHMRNREAKLVES
jgi:hypothetical protein